MMRQIVEDGGGVRFRGSLDNTEDLLAASEIAQKCSVYITDDEDEDYCEGTRICFNCRYRRWLFDGFQCMKNILRP